MTIKNCSNKKSNGNGSTAAKSSHFLINRFLSSKDVPDWFRGTSLFQIKAADQLFNSLRDDTEQRTCHRVRACLTTIGLDPMVRDKEIKVMMKLSRRNDIAFLWFLMEHHYKTPGNEYSLNEQLIMSSIAHLDTVTTMRELDRILPPGHPSAATLAKQKRIQRLKRLQNRPKRYKPRASSPYFDELRKPKLYGKPLSISPPPYEVKFSGFAQWKNPNHIVINESNRWYQHYKMQPEKRIANTIINEQIQGIFDDLSAASIKAETIKTLCEHHKNIVDLEKRLEQKLQVIARDKCLNNFNINEPKRELTERVKRQIEADVRMYMCKFKSMADVSRKQCMMKCITRDCDVDTVYDDPRTKINCQTVVDNYDCICTEQTLDTIGCGVCTAPVKPEEPQTTKKQAKSVDKEKKPCNAKNKPPLKCDEYEDPVKVQLINSEDDIRERLEFFSKCDGCCLGQCMWNENLLRSTKLKKQELENRKKKLLKCPQSTKTIKSVMGSQDSTHKKNLKDGKTDETNYNDNSNLTMGSGDGAAAKGRLSKNQRQNNYWNDFNCRYIANYDYGHPEVPTPTESQQFFKCPEDHKPYQFDYRNIFRFKENTSENINLRKAFVEALDSQIARLNELQEEPPNVDAAVKSCCKKIWKEQIDLKNEEDRVREEQERLTKETSGYEDYPLKYDKNGFFDCQNLSLMLVMLRDALAYMAKNPKFVLASMPDAYKLPLLREWICHRYGKLYTTKDRANSYAISLNIFHTLDKEPLTVRVPGNEYIGSKLYVDYSCRDYLMKKAKCVRENYYKRLNNELMKQARIFWFAMRPYLCSSGPPRNTFFAYMPSRPLDIQHFRLWRSTEFMPAKDAWDRRRALKMQESKSNI